MFSFEFFREYAEDLAELTDEVCTIASNDSGTGPMFDKRDSSVTATDHSQGTITWLKVQNGKHWKTQVPTPDPPLDTSDEFKVKPKGIRATLAVLYCLRTSRRGKNQDNKENSSEREKRKRKWLFGAMRVPRRNRNKDRSDKRGSGTDDLSAKLAKTVEERGDVEFSVEEIEEDLLMEACDLKSHEKEHESTTLTTDEIDGVLSDLTDDRSVMSTDSQYSVEEINEDLLGKSYVVTDEIDGVLSDLTDDRSVIRTHSQATRRG